jgi:phthalate 4,5-dioxygenase
VTVYIAPFTALIPPNNAYNVTSVIVPIDDTNSVFHFIAWKEQGNIDQGAWRKFNVAQPGIDLGKDFRNIRTRANNYQQDRNAMKLGDFTGIRGIPNQDIAMWETMGPIADRSKERLGASDLAVVEFRRIMVEAARAMHDGEPAIGTTKPRIPHAKIQSFEGVVPKGTNWRTMSMTDNAGAPTDKERVA